TALATSARTSFSAGRGMWFTMTPLLVLRRGHALGARAAVSVVPRKQSPCWWVRGSVGHRAAVALLTVGEVVLRLRPRRHPVPLLDLTATIELAGQDWPVGA